MDMSSLEVTNWLFVILIVLIIFIWSDINQKLSTLDYINRSFRKEWRKENLAVLKEDIEDY